MSAAAYAILALVAAQRLAELALARRNTARLLAAGGQEHYPGHYWAFVALHGGWLLAQAALVGPETRIVWPLIALFVLLQLGRVWVIATLGRFWTTRIVTLPTAPLVNGGPFRFVRHPNYLIVTAEIAVLPLAFGMVRVAAIASLLNAGLLAWRIRREDRVLRSRRDVRSDSGADIT